MDASDPLPGLVRLLRRLRALRPDVLHTHNPKPHLLGALVRRLASIPVLVHTKHGRNDLYPARTAFYNRIAASLSDAVVAVSKDSAEVAEREEGLRTPKLHVVHNGIDLEAFGAARRDQRRPARAICVARLSPVKDHDNLLRAARLVTDVLPSFRLDLVGDGPARASIEALQEELGLATQVSLLGQRDDVRSLLAAADLFVLN